jgi:hypothetical protein
LSSHPVVIDPIWEKVWKAVVVVVATTSSYNIWLEDKLPDTSVYFPCTQHNKSLWKKVFSTNNNPKLFYLGLGIMPNPSEADWKRLYNLIDDLSKRQDCGT